MFCHCQLLTLLIAEGEVSAECKKYRTKEKCMQNFGGKIRRAGIWA
jgi:hypothetical protein